MSTPLNLTLKRGPSVWDHQRQRRSAWPVYGVAAALTFAALATARRGHRPWLMGVVLGIAATGLLAGGFSSSLRVGARQLRLLRGGHNDRLVDRDSEDSFPASDPPQH
jgi:hypothetical protein